MKYVFSAAIMVSTLVSYAFSQDNRNQIVGVYQQCPFHCETIRINRDFTFDYLIDGDLYNKQRAKGTWQYAGENKIRLKTPERKLINQATEKIGTENDKIVVQVTDITGGLFAGITIKINHNGKPHRFVTGYDAGVELFKTDKIEFEFLGNSEIYEVKNPQTTQINIEIGALTEPSVDSTFILQNGKLCWMFEDGTISEYCHEKLKKSSAQKLFPAK